MEIQYAKIALKALRRYDEKTRERIRGKIGGLTKTPPVGDIKPIIGEDGAYRLRVGKFRVKFAYATEAVRNENGETESVKVLWIIDVDSRGEIYK